MPISAARGATVPEPVKSSFSISALGDVSLANRGNKSQTTLMMISIANRDLSELQKLALIEGIPYQTFITSILHKFADGKYIEKQH